MHVMVCCILCLSQARGYLQSLPPKIKVPWNKLYPSADPKGSVLILTCIYLSVSVTNDGDACIRVHNAICYRDIMLQKE